MMILIRPGKKFKVGCWYFDNFAYLCLNVGFIAKQNVENY